MLRISGWNRFEGTNDEQAATCFSLDFSLHFGLSVGVEYDIPSIVGCTTASVRPKPHSGILARPPIPSAPPLLWLNLSKTLPLRHSMASSRTTPPPRTTNVCGTTTRTKPQTRPTPPWSPLFPPSLSPKSSPLPWQNRPRLARPSRPTSRLPRRPTVRNQLNRRARWPPKRPSRSLPHRRQPTKSRPCCPSRFGGFPSYWPTFPRRSIPPRTTNGNHPARSAIPTRPACVPTTCCPSPATFDPAPTTRGACRRPCWRASMN